MNDLNRMSNEDLERMIGEAESCIQEIRAEMERRQQQTQHEAIDSLELYLEQADVGWSDVRKFFQQVLQELRR
ncbi:hypothetical protein FZZ93_10465 [Halomonas eurihalina]|uniref:Uncharacterized protein n=1 Tax=Halomonas eurihalina TaxID=42566 RepID=A0A5D9D6E6_HALER|nr:hypothetical protein [Halomonas eurihalina]MDR5859683.1 hypothetical protein [Halomonas eurihalina]TZG39139.1 hypothetical protein FZZ93_10465 [Halomonas eurihalina]